MSTVATTIDNFIGGAFAAPGDGATEEILNPATGEVIAVALEARGEELSQVNDGARSAEVGCETPAAATRKVLLAVFAKPQRDPWSSRSWVDRNRRIEGRQGQENGGQRI